MESQQGLCKRPAAEDACNQPSSKQLKHALEGLPHVCTAEASTSAPEAAAAAQLSFPILNGPQLSLAWGRTPGRTSSEPLLAGTPTHSAASEAPSLSNWARKSPPMGSPTSSLACSLQQWARCAAEEGPATTSCDRQPSPFGSSALPLPDSSEALAPPHLLQHQHQEEEQAGAAEQYDEDTADTATSSSSEGGSLSQGGSSNSGRHAARRARQQQQQRAQGLHTPEQEEQQQQEGEEEEQEDDHSINSSRPVTAGSPAFSFAPSTPPAAPGAGSASDHAAPAAAAAAAAEGAGLQLAPGPEAHQVCASDAPAAAAAAAGGELWLFCGQPWEGSALEVRSG